MVKLNSFYVMLYDSPSYSKISHLVVYYNFRDNIKLWTQCNFLPINRTGTKYKFLNLHKNVCQNINLYDFKLQRLCTHTFDKYICICNFAIINVSFKPNNLLTNDKLFESQPTYYGQ